MTNAPPAARFEHRVFAPSLAAVRPLLAAEAEAGPREIRDEVYLLGRRLDRNVKLREGALEVKALRETREGLERWQPVWRVAFPLDGGWIRGVLAACLGVEPLPVRDGAWSAEALLAELVAAAPGVRAVRVRKDRERFARGDVLAEFVRLRSPAGGPQAGGRRAESVAVESEDPAALRCGLRRLRLARRANTSYVRFLRTWTQPEAPR